MVEKELPVKNATTLSTYPNLISKGVGLKIESDDKYIYSIQTYSGKAKKSEPLAKKAIKQIEEYLSGKRSKFDLPLKLEGTDFQKTVWKNLAKIKYGKTISYQELAEKSGSEKAFHAAGGACGKNPCLIVIPCHRVVTKGGKLGGFAGGLDLKRKLLEIEGQESFK
jgi:methylated-DNA-[protein]-cysteine S-methyltransferase